MVRAMSLRRVGMLAALVGALVALDRPAQGQQPQGLVDKARITVERFLADPEMPTMRRQLGEARGIFIVPQLLKAGFIIGGAGGSGVLLARDPVKGWSGPAFYGLAQGSIGLQIGAQASEVVMLVMSEKALSALQSDRVKLGADAGIAVINIGKGVQASTTTNVGADIYAYSVAKGLYGGVSLEGALMVVEDDWNTSFYGRAATPSQILFERTVDNAGADELRAVLATAAKE